MVCNETNRNSVNKLSESNSKELVTRNLGEVVESLLPGMKDVSTTRCGDSSSHLSPVVIDVANLARCVQLLILIKSPYISNKQGDQ